MSQPAPDRIGGPPHEPGGPPHETGGPPHEPGRPPHETGGAAPARPDPDSLQRRIRQTREDLGQTVTALTAKAKVKARARAKAAEVADRTRRSAATTRLRESRLVGRARSTPLPLVMVVGSVAGLVGLVTIAVLVHRGRRSRSARGPRLGRR
jgi:hypothetical protein